MKVSVIIPVYNMEKSISKSVEAIINQTYKNIEIILVDDGSKDESLEICKMFEQKYENIKVYHTPNRGSGPARNYGIDKASGDFFYFPDADDYIEKNTIEILVKTVRENSCDLVVFGYRGINSRGKIIEEKRYPNLCISGESVRLKYEDYANMSSLYGIQGAPWNKFFSARIIRANKIEYPSLRRHQDEIFIARYITYTKKICFINDVLYTYYKNNLCREWVKYPIDYYLNVERVKDYKAEIILAWNPENKRMEECIDTEYICNYIKALELSFNEKYGFTHKSRFDWIVEKIKRKEFLNTIRKTKLNERYKYQRLIITLIINENYLLLYILLRIKIFYDLYLRNI